MPSHRPAAETHPDRSRNMAAIKHRDTKPELAVRSWLHAHGYRFRVDHPLRVGAGRPIRLDVVFPKLAIAVFIDSCFFHGCPEHGVRTTIKNEGYWRPKLARNAERDRQQTAALRSAGWLVLRFWTHEHPAVMASSIARAVDRQRVSRSGAVDA